MGVSNNSAASITVTSSTNLGTISSPPTISYTATDTNPGSTFGVDYYLDQTSIWFGAMQFAYDAWETKVTRSESFTIPSGTWVDIYDGDHTIILIVRNGTKYTNQVTVRFTRTGNPKPSSSGSSNTVYYPTTINPINPPANLPTFGDNEVVKMGTLRVTEGSNSVDYAQTTTKRAVYADIIYTFPRDRNGWEIVYPQTRSSQRVQFVDTNDESKKWTWVKTTLPNGNIIFIATTFAPAEYIHPLTEIRTRLNGVDYLLRNLSQREWLSIDTAVLDKIDFGNPDTNLAGGSNYSRCSMVTRTTDDDKDISVMTSLNDLDWYNLWKRDYPAGTNYVTMSYTSAAKAKSTGWPKGWGYLAPISESSVRTNLSWIPVLELKNTDPTIDLPDKNNNDPTVNI